MVVKKITSTLLENIKKMSFDTTCINNAVYSRFKIYNHTMVCYPSQNEYTSLCSLFNATLHNIRFTKYKTHDDEKGIVVFR